MIKRNGDFRVEIRENARGGEGTIFIEHLLENEEYYNKGRMFSKITVEPGCGLGKHTHSGEMEAFYIIKGEATVTDNDQTFILHEGDVMYSKDGDNHSLVNSGDITLEYIALIISK